ncbi:homeobox protein Hox-B13-like [Passer domesticus]|uniref:homeobox protein Hox-B13-like n=1 Tax=Passer domesticus TaxID=48849 RepID=UPI0030FF3496
MQPPALEGLLAPGGFAGGQPRPLLPPAPPPPPPPLAAAVAPGLPPPAGMNPGFAPEAPPEPPKPPPGSAASSSAPLPYGYFGSGFYSCRVARGSLKPPAGPQGPFPGPEKFLEPPGAGEEFPSRPGELAFYPGYGAPYAPVGGFHLDVAVLGEPRAEARLPPEPGGCPPAWHGWAGPLCCAKEQGQPGFLLKPAFAEAAGPCPAEGCALRRGRKKRVPYSKGQLRELEREFAGSRFISRERRRRIAAATGLSERQVTIWFQNRRVKDKKLLAKGKASAGGTA